jgi:hypothetical protein
MGLLQKAIVLIFFYTLIHGLNAQNSDPVVVELFTSQGCSSCPGADQLLSKLVKEKEPQVLGLSFHVDYWNRLGWKDPYSSKEFTQRQQDYARAFTSRQVYTPQMIVDGRIQFVGSSETKAREALMKAAKYTKVPLKLGLTERSDQSIIVNFNSVTSAYFNMIMNIALVEKDISTPVKRGENGGRILHHDNVVRLYRSLSLTSENDTIKLEIPSDVDISKASVIAYIQDPKTMQIHSACLLKLY